MVKGIMALKQFWRLLEGVTGLNLNAAKIH